MSKSSLKKLHADLSQSRELQQRFLENPEEVAADYGLSKEELALLESKDDEKLSEYLGEDVGRIMIRGDLE